MSRWSIGALIAATTAAAYGQAIDRRVDADPNGELVIENTAGSIDLEGWDRNEVYVTGALGQNVERLDVMTEGTRTVVRVVLDREDNGGRGRGNFYDGGTDLVIRAPAGMSVEIDAVSADIDVGGMRGEQRVQGVSSDIEIEAFGSEIRASTVSGDIEIDGEQTASRTRASAVSGDIELIELSGDIEAETVSGDVEYRGERLERGEFKSVSGDISVSTSLSENSRIEATATSGDIELSFTGSASAEYRLSTFSGDIDNCFGPAVAGQDGRFGPPGQTLRFTEGNSQARVEATSHSGDIGVCRN